MNAKSGAAGGDLPRQDILERVAHYAREMGAPAVFEAGVTPIPASGKVIGAGELCQMVDAVLDGWLTAGRFNRAFEQRLADYLGVDHVMTTNSGSSANLLAFSALTSPSLGERAIRPGDEVITVAAGFPTTINPILHNGCVPVFVDVTLPTYNIDVTQIEGAISQRTRAIMLAHTLGNPFDVHAIAEIAAKHGLWLIEDCCDALGARYAGRSVGTFGDLGTLSFYPAHHITMGEGGAVFTHNRQLKRIVESLRDWGRDCYCATGRENTCGQRFCQQHGELPYGYDHKYTYSHAGYNLKITDIQAACALAQMDRLPEFIATRRRHFARLSQRLAPLAEYLILPEATSNSEPSWFGFPLTLKPEADCNRVDLLAYLDEHRIGTRLLFAGNLTHQPYMAGRNFRIAGPLTHTDRILHDTFWIGLWPGLTDEMLDYVAERLASFMGVDPGSLPYPPDP